MTLNMYDNDTVKFNYKGNQYCLHVRQDDMPSNPRRDCDHEGTQMVCWHRDYDLGDECCCGWPEDYWHELVRKNVSDKEIFSAAWKKEFAGIRIVRNDESLELVDIYETSYLHTVLGDGEPEECLEYEAVPEDAVASYILDDLTIGQCMKLMKGKAVWLPLWLYDHSGITMSCGDRCYPYNDRWDSGQVGWIVCTKEDAIKKTGYKEEDWEKRAIDLMEAEVKVYDQYLTNDVYGFTLMKRTSTEEDDDEEAWEEVDSCCGFFGTDIMENGMCEYVPGLAEAIESGEYEEGDAKLVTHSYYTY